MSGRVRETPAAYGGMRRHFTVAEYYRAAEKGVFKPGERLELIWGEVYQKVSPQRSLHSISTSLAAKHIAEVFGEGYYVRQQMPLRLGEDSEPEPDVAIVRGSENDYARAHPSAKDVLLVVEVSDTTLKFDRGKKLKLYAESGIPEYWIVNLKAGKLEVYRQPSGGAFSQSFVVDRSGEVSPELGRDSIRASELLPCG